MNSKNILILLLIVVLIAFLAYTLVFGLNLGKYDIVPVKDLIKQGLDLRGGVTILYQAESTPEDPVTAEKMDRAIGTLDQRVNSLGVSEPTITKVGTDRIEVQLPDIKDPQQAIKIIGLTAVLQFRDEEGNVVLTGDDVKRARVVPGKALGTYEVGLELNPQGVDKFKEATMKNIGRHIGIYLDEKEISYPTVNEVIPNGEATINGMENMEEAKNLSTLINAGALPVKLTILSKNSVGPQLGANALAKSIAAAKIGILIVMLFMLLYYRVPGLLADIALVLYISITVMVMASIHAVLTLPGIAGIILSTGMAVDANVIIFERIKEELKLGKTLRAATDAGFRRAFLTILDSNITTLIAAFVLFNFGTGPIKGFAVTLTIGILASMFTAIVITRYLLKLMIGSNLIKSTKLYGA